MNDASRPADEPPPTAARSCDTTVPADSANGRYRTLFENMTQGAFVQAADGTLLDVNAAALELFGLERGEFLGRTSLAPEWDVVGEDGLPLPGPRHPSMLALASGRPVLGAVAGVAHARTRERTWLEINAIPEFRPGEAKPYQVLVTLHDVTRHRWAEEEHRVHVARLRLVERAPHATTEEVLVQTLDLAEELTGSRTGFYHFVEPDERTLSLQAWSTATVRDYCRAEGRGQHYDVDVAGVWVDCIRERRTVIHNDYSVLAHRKGLPAGHAEVLRMVAVPVFRGQRVVAVLGVGNKPVPYDAADARRLEHLADLAWDIAVGKRAEDERARLERQVEQSQRLESLGVLAGGIAHDFNNLLTGILGHAELALAHLDANSPEHQDVREIGVAARRAAELCAQMLAYSGRGRLRREPVDLGLLIEETLALVRASVTKRADLHLDLAREPLAMTGDASQVRQVVMNLLINASEAIGEANGRIDVTTAAVELTREDLAAMPGFGHVEPGPFVRLEVTDTGCGMDPRTLDRIFEPFFTTKFAGRGLGLSAVRGIVRGHGGVLAVASEPGRGTRFSAWFPRLQGPAAAAPAVAPGAADWHGEGTVLLVDDETAVRRVGEKMLRRMGFEVIVAADGLEALARFREAHARVRLVLLDLTMPNLGGEETCVELRAIDPQVRVVIMSGYSETDLEHRFGGGGLAGVLPKPFEFGTLRTLLAGLLPAAGTASPQRA